MLHQIEEIKKQAPNHNKDSTASKYLEYLPPVYTILAYKKKGV